MQRLRIVILFGAIALPSAGHADVVFLRGDANSNGSLEIGDAVYILAHLFQGQLDPLLCHDAMDANDDGTIDITDALYVIIHLFGGGTAPPPPFPACGDDPTADNLGCELTSAACPPIFSGPHYPARQFQLIGSTYIRLGDLNDDGILDVAGVFGTASVGTHLGVSLGNGDGTFAEPDYYNFSQTAYYDLELADLNDDGLVDILVASGPPPGLTPFINVGGGDLVPGVTTPIAIDGIVSLEVAHLDSDSFPDAVIRGVPGFGQQGFVVYKGDGDTLFTFSQLVPIAGGLATNIELADFSGDGVLDLVTASSDDDNAQFFLGSGQTRFYEPFIRGDVDMDGTVNMEDVALIQSFLDGDTSILPCNKGADANDDGVITVADRDILLDFLADPVTNPAPSAPHPSCGPDPTPDALTCAREWCFIRGDANQDNVVDSLDVAAIQSAITMMTPVCEDAADVDDNGLVNFGDVTYLQDYLNDPVLNPAPLAPFPACGQDPTSDSNADCAGSDLDEPFAFIRGDVNRDGNVDIGLCDPMMAMFCAMPDPGLCEDICLLEDFLAGTVASLPCSKAADVNDDGEITMADLDQLKDYVIDPMTNPAPAAPFPGPGSDPTDDCLVCGPFDCNNISDTFLNRPGRLRLADVTGDGFLDLLLLDTNSQPDHLLVFEGTGPTCPFFLEPPTYYDLHDFFSMFGPDSDPTEVVAGDLDGDLDLDVVVTGPDLAHLTILFNDGTGALTRAGGALGTIQMGASTVSGASLYQNLQLGDVDGDTDLDIVQPVVGGIAVRYNPGAGDFSTLRSYLTGANPQQIRLGDMNGDNHLDAVVATLNEAGGSVCVSLGAGDGTFGAFTAFSTPSPPVEVYLADFTGDTHLDALLRLLNQDTYLVPGDGLGGFGAGSVITDVLRIFGDIDNDGDQDLFGVSGTNVRLRRNDGSGVFAAAESFSAAVGSNMNLAPTSIVLTDANNDGWLDAYATRSATEHAYLENTGTGTFLPSEVNGSTASGTAVDLTADGVAEFVRVLSGGPSGHIEIHKGIGDGDFTSPAFATVGHLSSSMINAAEGTHFVDINGDCHTDVVFTTAHENVVIGFGDGTGLFSGFQIYSAFGVPETPVTTGGQTMRGLDIGDLNGDGLLDIVCLNNSHDIILVLLHETP